MEVVQTEVDRMDCPSPMSEGSGGGWSRRYSTQRSFITIVGGGGELDAFTWNQQLAWMVVNLLALHLRRCVDLGFGFEEGG